MDVDEDNCLSIKEIWTMILIIENIFYKEKNLIKYNSKNIFNTLSFNSAKRKFKYLMEFDYDENSNKSEELITFDEFKNNIKKKYEDQKVIEFFFCDEIKLFDFLENIYIENDLFIDCETKEIKNNFENFREKIHTKTSGMNINKEVLYKELPFNVNYENENILDLSVINKKNMKKKVKIIKEDYSDYEVNKNIKNNLKNLTENYKKKKFEMKNINVDPIKPSWEPINRVLSQTVSK